MSRRVSLPGADELFRTTGGMALQPSTPRRPVNGEARVPAPAGESDETAASAAEDVPQSVPVRDSPASAGSASAATCSAPSPSPPRT
ncbi:hypothetical protein ABT404_50320, partial [Streptomyces hyaluromycini]